MANFVSMTAEEKTAIARFLDLAAAVTGSGYRGEQNEYHFSSAPPPVSVPVADAAASTDADASTDSEVSTDADASVDTGVDQDSLGQIAADVRSCAACGLCETRKNAVPGEGVPRPLVMVIGEGPGADEDASGRPFVGRAGQLLDKMLLSIGLTREKNCFIANVIKCRPPANRDPQPQETAACASFLERQIQCLRPRFILCAGRIAAQTLLRTGEPIGRLRGTLIDFPSGGMTIPFIATYHPSALLRNEDLKRPAWEDLKLLRAALDSADTNGTA